ncbi:MAG: HD domain-containing protein [Bacillota bacterium]|nr:HD domain-containing protein [Bacillota bacterium]
MMRKREMEVVAAIDIGSNSLRMIIAEITKTKINILEDLNKTAYMGRDTFSFGRINPETIHKICDILSGFSQVMKEYGVKCYWAVSTSGIREAENREYVLEQIRINTGILVEVINNSQERFYIYKALHDRLPNAKEIFNDGALILNVGSGGVEVSVYEGGNLKFTEYLKLGPLRLMEILSDIKGEVLDFPALIGEFIDSKIYILKSYIKQMKIKNFIGLGGNIRIIEKLGIQGEDSGFIDREWFFKLTNRISSMSIQNISEEFDLSQAEAELLLCSVIIFARFLNMSEAKGIYAPKASLRNGLIADMADEKFNTERKKIFKKDILSSVWYIGEKYGIDKYHCKHVEKLAIFIFDHIGKVHRLGEKERTYLRVAAILHDVGKYIDLNRHDEQCYNIIHNEHIIGFSDRDTNITANVAKYHGEQIPSFLDENYRELNYKDKIIVSKLAAILKLAESLDISHKQRINKLQVEVEDKKIYFKINKNQDTLLEEWNFNNYTKFFEEVMGVKPVIINGSAKG